jgi:hypothetical protein
MVGSYCGSNRGFLRSRSSGTRARQASTSTKSALSGRTSYGRSSVGSNQAPRRSGSLPTLQYGGSADERPPREIWGGSRRGTSQGSGSMSNVTSFSSQALSVEDPNALYYSYRPRSETGRARRDDVLRAGRTFEVPERRAETRTRRRN